jgi:hypothetical protein
MDRTTRSTTREEPLLTQVRFPPGTLIPSLRLPRLAGGEPLELRSGRGPRIFLVLHAGYCARCADYLEEAAAIAPQLADWGARLIAIVSDQAAPDPAPQARGGPRVILVADPEAAFAKRLNLEGAAIVVTDEWGEIFYAAATGEEHALPVPAELVEWVRFLSIQCPECEQPEGEWREIS